MLIVLVDAIIEVPKAILLAVVTVTIIIQIRIIKQWYQQQLCIYFLSSIALQ